VAAPRFANDQPERPVLRVLLGSFVIHSLS
jgi:hypothetical protein